MQQILDDESEMREKEKGARDKKESWRTQPGGGVGAHIGRACV